MAKLLTIKTLHLGRGRSTSVVIVYNAIIPIISVMKINTPVVLIIVIITAFRTPPLILGL